MRTASSTQRHLDRIGKGEGWTKALPFVILTHMATIQLDLTGLKCPLPALKTRKALGRISGGDRLEVHCTDPLAAVDIPHLINETGDRIENITREADRITFLIARRTDP